MIHEGKNELKKMLLMGQHNAGKTSIYVIIFGNTSPRVNENTFKFMGNLQVNLWDCGGGDRLLDQPFTTTTKTIFSNVQVLIYVFNAEKEGESYQKELNYYKAAITSLSQYSGGANVFVLIHKFDKVKDSEKKIVFERKQKDITSSAVGLNIEVKEVFATSIWDETLYKAWSQIVQNLIPNINIIKESLRSFCQTCSCDEVVLFEQSTFLIIDFQDVSEKKDIVKYERLSNIIKQFQQSCMKTKTNIQVIQIKSEKFAVYIGQFTDNTFIMLVFNDQQIYPAAIQHNVTHARKMFEQINGSDTDKLKILIQKKH